MSSWNARKQEHPLSLYFLTAVLVFLAMAALGGGAALVGDPDGSGLGLDAAWLAGSPFVSYLVPGVILFVVFGLGSAALVYALWFKPAVASLAFLNRVTHEHWAWGLTLLLGLAALVWIGVQYLIIQTFSPMQIVIVAVGLVIIMLTLLPGMRRYYKTP
jgi:hypothetical protein